MYDRAVFSNLTHLELVFGTTGADWYMVYGMLNDCPNLQNFVFDKPPLSESFDAGWYEQMELRVVPKCFSSQFRKCTIKNYRYEFGFVKYIMQNSTSLRCMALYTPASLDDPFEKLEILNELFSIRERTSTYEIVFI